VRQYLLYKTAGDEDKKDAKPSSKDASKQRAMLLALTTLGGGGMGYLLTRYGLGLKGAGAGILGAGLGATAGAGVGSYLSAQGKKKEKEYEDYDKLLAEKKKLANRGILETAADAATGNVAKVTGVAAPVFGIGSGLKSLYDLNKLEAGELAKFEAAQAGKPKKMSIGVNAPKGMNVSPGKIKSAPGIPTRAKLKTAGKGALATALRTLLYGGAAAGLHESAKSWAAGGVPEPLK